MLRNKIQLGQRKETLMHDEQEVRYALSYIP